MPEFEYRKQQEKDWADKSAKMLKELPRICSVYVNGIEGYTSPLTIYIYLSRLYVFFLEYCTSEGIIGKDEVRGFDYNGLGALELIDIEAFTHWLREGNASNGERLKESSINNYLSALNSLWEYAQSHGYIQHNIIKDIKRAKKQKKPVVALDRQQTKKMQSQIENGFKLTKHQDDYRTETSIARDKAIYLTLVRTGLRVSELVGINVDDINFDKHFIRVRRKENKIMDVYIGQDAEDAIKDYLNLRPNLHPDKSNHALFLVTIGKYKGQRLSVRSVQQLIKKYAKISVPEVRGEVTPHKMRSTYATQMIKATGDISLVQQLMAHENPATTAIYIADRAKEMEEHRNDLDE